MADGEIENESGVRITKEQVVKNYTDDARLTDVNWDGRHHVTASTFNGTNTKYYKVSCPHKTWKISFENSLWQTICFGSNTSIKSIKISRECFWIPRDSWIRMKRTRWRELECQTTPKWLRKGTFTASWAGFQTSMSSTPRITTRCTLLTESSLMVQKTIITSSTPLRLLTKNFSVRMLQLAQLLNFLEMKIEADLQFKHLYTKQRRRTSEVKLWTLISKEVTTLLHSSCRKKRTIVTKLQMRLSAQWARVQKSHFCVLSSIPTHYRELRERLLMQEQLACRAMLTVRKAWKCVGLPARSRAGTITSSLSLSSILKFILRNVFRSNRFENQLKTTLLIFY